MSSQEFIKSHYLSLYECFVANVQESLLDVLDQNVDMTKEQKEKTIKIRENNRASLKPLKIKLSIENDYLIKNNYSLFIKLKFQ
jgi:hypothetical protein